MHVLKGLFFGALMGIASGVHAANSQWSGDVTVHHLDGASSMTVYLNGSVPNPAGCSQGALMTVSWEKTDPAAQNFMSMMLSAHMTKQTIQILVDGNTCLWGGWPKLESMRVM